MRGSPAQPALRAGALSQGAQAEAEAQAAALRRAEAAREGAEAKLREERAREGSFHQQHQARAAPCLTHMACWSALVPWAAADATEPNLMSRVSFCKDLPDVPYMQDCKIVSLRELVYSRHEVLPCHEYCVNEKVAVERVFARVRRRSRC